MTILHVLNASRHHSPRSPAILWGGATLPGALVAALAGSYSLIALTVRDRLEAL